MRRTRARADCRYTDCVTRERAALKREFYKVLYDALVHLITLTMQYIKFMWKFTFTVTYTTDIPQLMLSSKLTSKLN